MQPTLSLNNRISKYTERINNILASKGSDEAFLRMFLDPQTAQNPSQRFLYPNARARPACPVYQKAIFETSTVDIGDHQVRGVMLQPSPTCPVMLSHSYLVNHNFTLFAGRLVGQRVVDTVEGEYGGNQLLPPFRSHQLPSTVTLLGGTPMPIPIHGSFGNTAFYSGAVNTGLASVSFRDFTEVLNAGISTGVNVLPAFQGEFMTVSLRVGFGTLPLDNSRLLLDVSWANNVGTLATNTSAFIFPTTPQIAEAPGVCSAQFSMPTGSVGIASISLRSPSTATYNLYDVLVQISSQTAVPAGALLNATGLGVYAGQPVSGIASIGSAAHALRMSAGSLLLTNTSSSLNTNGFIVGTGFAGLPSTVGINGENTIGSQVSSRSFALVDGSYASLAPKLDLPFESVYAQPDMNSNRVLWILKTQDNTPISLRLRFDAVIEIVSQDPLFPPLPGYCEPIRMAALNACQESEGYLILTENPFHLSGVAKFIGNALNMGGKLVSIAHPVAGMMMQRVGSGISTAAPIVQKVEDYAKKHKLVKKAKQVTVQAGRAVRRMASGSSIGSAMGRRR